MSTDDKLVFEGVDMRAMAFPIQVKTVTGRTEDPVERQKRNWTMGLLVSGSLGVLAGLFGVAISLGALVHITGARLSTLGTVLVAVSFPLLVLAAHSLDKIGEAKKKIRSEYCRNHGLKDGE